MSEFARALERIMRARHPEYAWVVTPHPDADKRQRALAARLRGEHPRTVTNDLNPVTDRNEIAAADTPDDDRLHEAA